MYREREKEQNREKDKYYREAAYPFNAKTQLHCFYSVTILSSLVFGFFCRKENKTNVPQKSALYLHRLAAFK